MKKIIIIISILGLCIFMHAIQIIDNHSSVGSLPIDFIKQSEYFQGLLTNPDYKQPLQIPADISTEALLEFFERSKDRFIDIPLEKLTHYFIIANALLFSDMQQELLQLIYHQLQQLPSTVRSIQAQKLATKKVLRQILGLPQENFDDNLTDIVFANTLNTEHFQKKVKNYVLNKYPATAQYPAIFRLPLPSEFSPNKLLLITSNPDQKIILWGDSHTYPVSATNAKMFFTRGHEFDWNSIYLYGTHPNHFRLYLNPKALITLYYRNTHRSVLTTTDLSQFASPNQKWSHAAFSLDGSKITASNNGITYLIDYTTSKVTSLDIPHQVFSSLLLAKDILLYRTIDKNTFLYNLTNKTSKKILGNLDYYIMAVPENPGIRVYGLKQINNTVDEDSEYIKI